MARAAGKLLGGAIVAALALVALAYGWLQTEGGRNWLAGAAGRMLSDDSETATVSGISGRVPFDFSIASVVIADKNGPRLTIDGASIDISAWDLVAGRLVIRHVAAHRIEFARQGSAAGGTDWQAFLHPPLPVRIESARIDALALGAPVLGQAMTLEASARGATGGGAADADVALHRVDGTPGELALHLAFDGTTLALQGQVSEPTGTVLAGLLGRQDRLPLAVVISGSGPLDHWRGDLSLAAGSDASAKGTVTISGDEPRRIELAASAQVASILPPDFRALAAGGVRIDGAVALGTQDISVERLDIASAAARVSGSGSFARKGERIGGSARIGLSDLAVLSPIAGVPLEGSGTAKLDVGGTLSLPALAASLDLAGLASGKIRAASAHATISLLPAGDPRSTPTAITAAGWFAGLAPLPQGVGSTAQWRVAGSLDPRSASMSAATIALADGGITLDGSARADRAGASGVVRLVLPELAAVAGGALAGALDASADFRVAADGTGIAVLSGAIAEPRTGTAAVDAALGRQINLSGTVSRETDGTIAAREIALDAAAARISGEARRLPDGTLALNFAAALPRLAALDPRFAGAASATGKIAGPPDALSGVVTIDAPTLALSGIAVTKLAAQLSLAQVWPLSARLEAKASVRGIAATIAGEASAAPGELRVARFEANAAGARATGSLGLVRGRLDAALKGTVPDLKPFAAAAGVPLAGRATLDARVAGQHYVLSAAASGLSAAGVAIEHAQLAVDVSDPFARPTGSVQITLADIAAGGVNVAAAKIAAKSSGSGRFALDGSAHGKLGAPFTLATNASLALDRGAGTLSLARFAGAIGSAHFALAAPLGAEWRNGNASFSNLALKLGSGSLSGDGAVQGNALNLHLLARDLPVRELAELANYQADGQLGFELTAGGTRRAPEAHFVVDGEELRLAAESRTDLPALGLVMDGTWQGGTVRFKGRLAGPGGAAIGWQGEAPLVLDPARLGVSVPRQGALALHLEGDGELAMLSDLLPLGQDRIAGHFATELRVAGTVAQPEASGRLGITGGRYESLYTGGVLSGVTLTLVGDHDRLVLENFAASDGANGSVRASGAIDLAGPDGLAFDATAELKNFRALRRDEASATASGTVRLSGALAAPKVTAALTIDGAEIAVPRELPSSSRPVAAVVIDSAAGTTLSEPQAAAARGLVAVALDVTIDIPGRTFVRGRGLDSEWRGRVALAGSSQAPLITGRLEIVHGTYDFIGKTFNLSRGAITFLGGRSIDPTIDLEASAQSSEVTAIVDITGTATEPTIKLSSQPALPRDEILSRLLFGTSMSQIGAAQGLRARLGGGLARRRAEHRRARQDQDRARPRPAVARQRAGHGGAGARRAGDNRAARQHDQRRRDRRRHDAARRGRDGGRRKPGRRHRAQRREICRERRLCRGQPGTRHRLEHGDGDGRCEPPHHHRHRGGRAERQRRRHQLEARLLIV